MKFLKTLYRGAEILIFDEPTAISTPQEITELMEIMKPLVKRGKSIILITHKLKEIMEVADRVTVIRRGKALKTLNVSDTNPTELVSLMVGRDVIFSMEKKLSGTKRAGFKSENLVVKDYRGPKR